MAGITPAAGIKSVPPAGKKRILNVYVDQTTDKFKIEWED